MWFFNVFFTVIELFRIILKSSIYKGLACFFALKCCKIYNNLLSLSKLII